MEFEFWSKIIKSGVVRAVSSSSTDSLDIQTKYFCSSPTTFLYRRIICVLSDQPVVCNHKQESCSMYSRNYSFWVLADSLNQEHFSYAGKLKSLHQLLLPFYRQGLGGGRTLRIGFYRWFSSITSKSKGKMKRIPGKVFINPWDWMTSIRDC